MELDLPDIPTRKAVLELSKIIPEVDVSGTLTLLSFFKTSAKVDGLVHDNMAEFGVSHGKFTVLLHLYRNPDKGLLPSEIADMAGVSRATVTGLLDGLERDKFIKRINHPKDRRMSIIKLTDQGLAMLEELLPKHFILMSKVMNHLSLAEKEQLTNLLKKIEEGVLLAKETES